MKHTYMLDTCICSFIMREHPIEVLQKLQAVSGYHQIVISAITYSEMRYGAVSKRTSPKVNDWINQFVNRLDAILPWDAQAVDQSAQIKKQLCEAGTPIGSNDMAIAGHALATGSIVVTNNTREFNRVRGLKVEDWVNYPVV